MNTNRREFLRNLGSKAACATAAVATPVAVYAADFSSEIKKISGQFNRKLDQATEMIGGQIGHLNNRIDAAAMTQAYLQTQLHLIFWLLVISFVIDGGMTLTWVF